MRTIVEAIEAFKELYRELRPVRDQLGVMCIMTAMFWTFSAFSTYGLMNIVSSLTD